MIFVFVPANTKTNTRIPQAQKTTSLHPHTSRHNDNKSCHNAGVVEKASLGSPTHVLRNTRPSNNGEEAVSGAWTSRSGPVRTAELGPVAFDPHSE